jgi:hypothetical protein
MKINEVILEADQRYSEKMAREIFVSNFIDLVKQNQKASKKAGVPLNVKKMIDSYLMKYGWQTDPEQQLVIDNLADKVSQEQGIFGGSAIYAPNLKKLANAMYMIGAQQVRDPRTNTVIQPTQPTQAQQSQPVQPVAPVQSVQPVQAAGKPAASTVPNYAPRWR